MFCQMPGCIMDSPGAGIFIDGKILCLFHYENRPSLFVAPAYSGSFAEHGERAWAHRIVARSKAGIKVNPFALRLAQEAIKAPQ